MGSGASGARNNDVAQPKELINPKLEEVHTELLGGGCIIHEVENRAITIQQLQDLVRNVETKVKEEKWVSTSPQALKPVKLKAKSVNLYDLVAWLVKPATAARRCSYVELVATGPQPTRWFTSHWWGEPVFQFVTCVVKHSEQRRLGIKAAYWVCAYANNQWDLASDLVANPAESSFRRALDVAEGTLSILDGSAIAYSRVWCNYEMFVTLEKAKSASHLFDIYTFHAHQPRGITDGITEGDMRGASWWWEDRKWTREKNFPVNLAQAAMQARVELAEASVDMDRIHILNAIVGAEDLNQTPPLEHECYDFVNTTLHARFALATFKLALEAGLPLESHVRVISYSHIARIDLSFRSSEVLSDHVLMQLSSSLPSTLRELSLNVVACKQLSNQGIQALAHALHQLPLESLHLDLAKNVLTDAAVQALAASHGSTLKHLWLSLGHLASLTDVSGECVASALPTGLKTLFLAFVGCRQITGKTLASLSKSIPPTATHLHLLFGDCHLLDDAASVQLFSGLPQGLLELELDFWACSQLTQAMLEALGAKLPSTVSRLELTMGEIPAISGVYGRRYAKRELKETPPVLLQALGHTNVSIEYLA